MLLPRLPAVLLVGLCSLAGCDPAPDHDAETTEDALITLPRLASWTRVSIARRGRVRIAAPTEAGARYTLTITDHWGWRAQRPRPAVTLDVDVRTDRGRSLTGTLHNTSRDSNGTEPDPITFRATSGARVLIDIREVDDHAGDFELRLDRDDGDATPPPGVVVHQSGETSTDVSPTTTFTAMLAGGGPDHDAATSALIEAGGHGDAVIFRMDDTGGAYARYFVERGAHAATEVAFDPDAGNDDVTGAALVALRARADDPWIEARINAAEVLFFAGGNQTKYVDAWRGTRLAAAVDRLVARGGAVGGTSAGMHLLAGVVHTPRGAGDSVTSTVALRDPYIDENEHEGTRSLAFAPGPFALPLLTDVIADTHWSERARLGRSVTFLARVLTDELRPLGRISLIACDEGVAVLFDAAGRGRVFGPPGRGAFLFRPEAPPDRCADDQTLDWRAGVAHSRAEATATGRHSLHLSSAPGALRARVIDGELAP